MKDKLPQPTERLAMRLRRVAKSFERDTTSAPAITHARANTCWQAAARLDELDKPTNLVQKCLTCRHLNPFELTDDLFTCPVVNIRIHRSSLSIFGCNQHELPDAEMKCSRD